MTTRPIDDAALVHVFVKVMSPLPYRVRADLFTQLAALEQAGIPPDRTFTMLDLPASAQPHIVKMRASLAGRMSISSAGLRSALFTQLEATLIRAATESGSPAYIYRRLADYYAQRARQVSAIRSRLALPAFVVVAGLFIQPLPALIAHRLTPGGYVLHGVGSLIGLAIAYKLATLLPGRLRDAPRTSLRSQLEKMYLRLPMFGAMHLRRNIRDFVESLALLVEAGMPILDALPIAVDTMQNHEVRTAFARIGPGIAAGATLTDAVATIPALAGDPMIDLIRTGEASGALPQMLFHHAKAESNAIDAFNAQMALWIPRLIYMAVAAWIAYGILSGGGIGPVAADV